MGHRPAGALEQEVLGILAAAREPLTPAAVQQRLSQPLAYTTVMTALTRLYEKGAATRTAAGRGYAYSFAADPSTLTARKMRRLLDRGGDRHHVLASFVAELDPADEELLQRLLRESPAEPA